MRMKTRLLGKTPSELGEIAKSCSLPSFTGKQIAEWIYRKGATSISQMTNISLKGRDALGEIAEVGRVEPLAVQQSADGTRKYLFPVACTHLPGLDRVETVPDEGLERSSIETVMIPEEDRRTLCVSSQAGCKMGCAFCMTGRQGFHGNLSSGDIINQFLSVAEASSLTNAVFMGMGEPLDNSDNVFRALEILTSPWGFAWSPKRITVSTIGVIPRLREFLDRSRCHLAVSLHDPFGEERGELMPVQGAYPIEEVVGLLHRYDFTGQRRVSFEYTMFAGLNDTPRHARALAELLRGLECRVNLIRFHAIPDFPYRTSTDAVMQRFQSHLLSRGITTTIRASRGEDIYAACGLLAGRNKDNSTP